MKHDRCKQAALLECALPGYLRSSSLAKVLRVSAPAIRMEFCKQKIVRGFVWFQMVTLLQTKWLKSLATYYCQDCAKVERQRDS